MIEKRTILVRYDEIGLKGGNRKYFTKILLKNIKRSLPGDRGIEYRVPRGRILIDLPKSVANEITDQLKMIPGIASYSIGISVNPDFDEIAGLGVKLIEPLLKSKGKLKFCVRTRRSAKTFPKTSPEVNFEVGSRIMSQLQEKGLVVDIKGSEFTLEVEIGATDTIIFDNRHSGLS